MIEFQELDKRIRKQYPAVLKALVLGENLFPLYLRVNKTPDADFTERNRKLEALFQNSSHHRPFGYHIETETVNRRQHGVQDEPVAFHFDTLERYLGYIDKQNEYKAFAADVRMVLEAFPMLQAWMAAHTTTVIDFHGKWPQLLQVLHYFMANPKPGLFVRELPLQGLGTKFVERHIPVLYPLLNQLLPPSAIDEMATGPAQFERRFGLRTDAARVRFRWLDPSLAVAYTGGLVDLSVPVSEIAQQPWQVKRVLIVENKANLLRADVYLTLPAMEGALAIFGSGRAAALLAGIEWLRRAEILYWGDIDAEGFEILDNLMNFFPHTHAFCMDYDTLQAFRAELTKGSGAAAKALTNLSPEHLQLYREVCNRNWRLEQEQVTLEWVKERLPFCT